MKIAVDIGHNVNQDGGARGIRSENELTKEVGEKLIQLLEREGHQVINCLPSSANSVWDSLAQRVRVANSAKADLFVSIHFNAFNKLAYGSEVWLKNSGQYQRAINILQEINKLGFFNRGVKYGNFYVLRKTTMPAILVECCFCDSARDMSLYDSGNMAIAIKNGILGKSGHYSPSPKTQMLKVLHQTWIKGAVEPSESLNRVMFTRPLQEAEKYLILPGAYTLESINPVEEAHHWIKLKSGLEGFVYWGHVQISNQ